MNELKAIREALDLSQAAMGELYGVKQGVYQRWEAAPHSKAGREALEKAKGFYKKQKRRDWESQPATGPYVTREEYGALDARLKAAEKSLEETRNALIGATGAIRLLATKAGLHEILELLK